MLMLKHRARDAYMGEETRNPEINPSPKPKTNDWKLRTVKLSCQKT